MTTTEHATLLIKASPQHVRDVLLDPLALPAWNPAFNSIDGPSKATTGYAYRISVRQGLSGHFTYDKIDPNLIRTTWHVLGFTETGTWLLREHNGNTVIDHDFTHTCPLAALLSRAYRGVAELRLQRLARHLAD